MSEAIAQQERDRLKALAKREKLDRRKTPYTAYYGTDSDTGQVRVKPLGSNGVVGVRSLSNAQPSMGQYGRGGAIGFDAGNVRRLKEPIFPSRRGNIKVCLKVFLENGDIQYWLGGDRPQPKLIYTVASNSEAVLEAEFEATGPNKNNWIFAIKTELNGVPRLRTFSGDGAPIDSGVNPLVSALVYKGAKFWASEAIVPLFRADPNRSVVVAPSLYGSFSDGLPAAPTRGVRVFLGNNGRIESFRETVSPRVAIENATPYPGIYPLSLEIQGNGSYFRADTTTGLMSQLAFEAKLYGHSNFDFRAGAEITEYGGGFTEQFTTNSVAAHFFLGYQQNTQGTDNYQSNTVDSGTTSRDFFIQRNGENNQAPTFGVEASFTLEPTPINGMPPLIEDFTLTGSANFENSSRRITTTTREGTYPIYLSPNFLAENTAHYEYFFDRDATDNILFERIGIATRKTYKSLKVYGDASSIFYSQIDAEGVAANVSEFYYDVPGNTTTSSQVTTSFFLKFGNALPIALNVPPIEPYNEYTWVKSDSALQLYKVDPQPFNTDSGGNPAIAILRSDIKADVAFQNLVADAFVPASATIEAKALKMGVPGATNQNTTLLRAHYWPKLAGFLEV